MNIKSRDLGTYVCNKKDRNCLPSQLGIRGVPMWVFLLKPISDIYYVKSCRYRLLIRYSKFIVYALKVTENSI